MPTLAATLWRRKLLLSLGCLLLLGSCSPEASAPAAPPYEDVRKERFAELMEGGNAVVLDVRTPPEIAAGKIAGALELDYKSPDFRERLAALDTTKTYLVYCRSGNRSGKACAIMAEMGYDTLYNLAGGYLDWADE